MLVQRKNRIDMNKCEYVHIIEYPERGTLWRLLKDLTIYPNHHILETKGQYVNLFSPNSNMFYIFHTSGRSFPMVDSLIYLLNSGFKCCLFIHTAPDYIVQKGYPQFLEYVEELQKQFKIKVMVPSWSVKIDFARHNIECDAVRLGIFSPSVIEPLNDLSYLTNKIITVNTNNKYEYKLAKGIDRFCEIVECLGLQHHVAILGVDGDNSDGIFRKKLSYQEFMWVLSKSRMYVQLSRSESYNITAIEARQLKIPLLLSNVGGHMDCNLDSIFLANSKDDAITKMQNLLLYEKTDILSKIENNYIWSITNESLEAFRKKIESILV